VQWRPEAITPADLPVAMASGNARFLGVGRNGRPCHGRHDCHSALPSAAIGCHPLGIYTVVLLSSLSFSAKMTVSRLLGQPVLWIQMKFWRSAQPRGR
jgi:hypothetical protein